MRRKSVRYLLALILVTFFITNNLFISTAEAATSAQDRIANEFVKKLKKQKEASGWDSGDVFKVRITGSKVPEVVKVLYKKDSKNYIWKNKINIYGYNTKAKKWSITKTINVKNTYTPLLFITKGTLIDHDKEQFVLGEIDGSGAYLTPKLYGINKGKEIKLLLDIGKDDSFYAGNAVIKGKQLYIMNSRTIVVQKWKWQNNKFIRTKGNGSDDRYLAKGSKHLLLLERRNGATVLASSKTIKMKVGEKVSIVRKNPKDNYQYAYRLFIQDALGLNYQSNTSIAQAKKPGKYTWWFEPDAYGEQIKVNIHVTK